MKLSIIIVNYNHKYFPRLAIEAIKKSDIPFSHEIIVVDNNSTDESVQYLEKAARRGDITLIRSPKNVGFGAGNNLGAKNAQGEFLLFHNPDITVEPHAITTLVYYLEKHSDIGILAPKLVYHNGEVQASCRRHMKFWDLIIKRTFLRYIPQFRRRLAHYLMHDFHHEHTQDVELVTGAAMLMRKSVFDSLEGFDPWFFLFMEDFDLCQRVRKKGYRVVYYPEAEFIHYHKRLSGGNIFALMTKKVFWLHVASAIKYHWRWP